MDGLVGYHVYICVGGLLWVCGGGGTVVVEVAVVCVITNRSLNMSGNTNINTPTPPTPPLPPDPLFRIYVLHIRVFTLTCSYLSTDHIGHCTVSLRSLSLPNGVPLYLDVPLEGVPHGSVQMELLLQELDH